MASKAFENPLLSNARMRAMYRALVEVRALGARLGPRRRLPRNLEACWVGPAIGLEAQDLTSDVRGTAVLQHIREVGERTRDTGPRTSALKQLADLRADRLVDSAYERLLCAVGSARALRQQGGGVLLAYAAQDELRRAEWLRLFAILTRGDAAGTLPLLLVVTPGAARATPLDFDQLSRRAGKAEGRRVPVLPVDAADAVALYRAAQESLGRARATGGAVVIDCVRSSSDPVRLLAEQLQAKRIASASWCERVAQSVRD